MDRGNRSREQQQVMSLNSASNFDYTRRYGTGDAVGSRNRATPNRVVGISREVPEVVGRPASAGRLFGSRSLYPVNHDAIVGVDMRLCGVPAAGALIAHAKVRVAFADSLASWGASATPTLRIALP